MSVPLKFVWPATTVKGSVGSPGESTQMVRKINTNSNGSKYFGSLIKQTIDPTADPAELAVLTAEGEFVTGFGSSYDSVVSSMVGRIADGVFECITDAGGNTRAACTFDLGPNFDTKRLFLAQEACCIPIRGCPESPIENLSPANPVVVDINNLLAIEEEFRGDTWVSDVMTLLEVGYFMNHIVSGEGGAKNRRARRAGTRMSDKAIDSFAGYMHKLVHGGDVDKAAIARHANTDLLKISESNLLSVALVPILLLMGQGNMFGAYLTESIDLLGSKFKAVVSLLSTEESARDEAQMLLDQSFDMPNAAIYQYTDIVTYRLMYACLTTMTCANEALGGGLKVKPWVLRMILFMVSYHGTRPMGPSVQEMSRGVAKLRADAVNACPGGAAEAAVAVAKGINPVASTAVCVVARGPLGRFVRNLLRVACGLGQQCWTRFNPMQEPLVDLILTALIAAEKETTFGAILTHTGIPRSYMSIQMLNLSADPKDVAGTWAAYMEKHPMKLVIIQTVARQVFTHIDRVQERAASRKRPVGAIAGPE